MHIITYIHTINNRERLLMARSGTVYVYITTLSPLQWNELKERNLMKEQWEKMKMKFT